MTNTTAIQTREIRVFLSSTFRDMDAERSHLVKQVFPKVRATCLERQVGFSEIDLRWGVSEEESKNGATVEICLKEIDRCRDFPPFFVGFLGERYGWVPREEELAAYWEKHGDSQYAPDIRQAIERSISVTELEMELAVLGEGAADKIAGHALFCLRDAALTDALYREQTGKAADHHDPAFYDAGNGKLAALKANIRQSGYLGLDNYTSIEQFGSAVENYLLAQLDRYFPADAVPSAFERGNAAHAAFRFHRLQNFLPRIDVREHMIRAIEQRIEAPSLGPILVTGPSGQGKSALMADLARHMHNQPVANQPLPPHRGKVGMGVSSPIETTNATTASNPSTPSPILPLPGGGSDEETETWRVIDHYIGADNGNHLEGWVERVLQTLHPDIADLASGIPESPKDKIEALSTWISMAARRNHCRYLFILDALDQLGDGGQKLDILTPQTLGPDGILIASAADGTPALTSAANWQTRIEVPPLTGELRTQLVTDTLARYRKRLPENLAKKLAHAPQSGSPLYLGLALEELRVDARHETLDQLIDDILKQPDAEHLFLNNFLLDEDNGRPELPTLAASFMALLGAARAGLSEDELADLLAMPTDPISEDTGKPRLPQVHLSKLLNNLAPFLLNKQGRRAPMHRIFGEVALEYYDTAPVREHLYAHFAPGYGKGADEYDARGAAEALHQITELAKLEHPKQKQARKQLVTDLGYLPFPVKLHDGEINAGEELILEGIGVFTKSEQSQVKKLWEKEIGKLDAEDVDNAGSLICGFGSWLKYWSCYSLALAVLELLIKRQEKLLPPDHLDIGNSSNLLGTLFLQLARFQEAMTLFRRALAIRESQLGAEHPDTAMSIGNLATLLKAQGDYAGAEPLYRRALAICESQLGIEHPHTATSLNNLAVLLQDQGDYAGAESLYRRALAISEKSLGAEHPDTAISLGGLAGWLYSQGDYAEAEPLYRRALAICESQLGLEHPDTATRLNSLAVLLQAKGDYAGAELLYRRALAICESQLGLEHPDTAKNLDNLAVLLKAKGDYVEAEPLFRRSLAIRESQLGAEHPDTARSLSILASSRKEQGDYAEAELLYRRSLNIREKVLPDHPDTASCLYNLAEFLDTQNNGIGVEPLYRRALSIMDKSQYHEHPSISKYLTTLALLLQDQGDFYGAEPLYRRALSVNEKYLGPDHPDTATTLTDLSVLLYGQGKQSRKAGEWESARAQLNEALELARRAKNQDVAAACQQELKKLETVMQQQVSKPSSSTIQPTPKGESTMSMRITETIVKWLEEMEWEERPKIDEEEQTSTTGFGHSVGDDFSVKCYLDAAEKAGFIKLFMYFRDSKIPESKINEVIKFVNLVNVGIPIGLLAVIPDDRVLRFYAAIDVEEAALEPRHISNLLGAGLRTMERRLPQFMAICFGGKTAEEALEIELE